MLRTHNNQHIDIKGLFTILLAILCVVPIIEAQAQTTPPSLTGSQIQEITAGLENITNLDPSSAANLLDGLTNGDIDLSQFEELQEMIENLQENILDPEMLNDLIDNVAEGLIPPELGEALSAIEGLQALTEIEDLQDLLEIPQVEEALEGLLENIELPEELAEVIDALTEIVSDIEALPSEIAAAIVDALPDELIEALGGDEAVQEALAGILGGGGGTNSGTPGAGEGCGTACSTCSECPTLINRNHQRIRTHASAEFSQHRNWIVANFFSDNIAPALAIMTSQLTTIGIQQVQIIGSFFDAKHQLETQRLFQTMTAQAHKDYQPSEGLCRIGTNVRSLAASTQKSNMSQQVIATRMMNRQLSNGESLSSQGSAQDRESRLTQFISTYCNKFDHAGSLIDLCIDGVNDPTRTNLDINYTDTIGSKLTLQFDATDSADASEDEEDIFALSSNLFANEVLPTIPGALLIDNNGGPTANVNFLIDVRALAAKRSVAQNSFAAITALKAEGDTGAAPFLKAILAESGISSEEIENRLGEKPSYHAQMEVLTKDIYQNPNFYSNLYDKPVNIERKSAALLAIELMQDRDIYDSLLRSEAVIATLIEVMLQKEQDRVSNDLNYFNPFDIDAEGPQ